MTNRLFHHVGWLGKLEVQGSFRINSCQLLHLLTIVLLRVLCLVTKGNCKVLGSYRPALAREIKCVRGHWSVIDHKLAWCTCSFFDLESFWSLTSVVNHKLARTSWSVINHELAWCLGPVIDCELFWSSCPIVDSKLIGPSSPIIYCKLVRSTCSVINPKAIRSPGPFIDSKLIRSHRPLISLELRIAVQGLLQVICLATHRNELGLLKVVFRWFLLVHFVRIGCYWCLRLRLLYTKAIIVCLRVLLALNLKVWLLLELVRIHSVSICVALTKRYLVVQPCPILPGEVKTRMGRLLILPLSTRYLRNAWMITF